MSWSVVHQVRLPTYTWYLRPGYLDSDLSPDGDLSSEDFSSLTASEEEEAPAARTSS